LTCVCSVAVTWVTIRSCRRPLSMSTLGTHVRVSACVCVQCDCQVPLLLNAVDSVADTYRGIDTFLTPLLLTRIRRYLGYVQMLAYNVTDDVQKVSVTTTLLLEVYSLIGFFALLPPPLFVTHSLAAFTHTSHIEHGKCQQVTSRVIRSSGINKAVQLCHHFVVLRYFCVFISVK